MRTAREIESNIKNIRNAMSILREQIDLLESEYQSCAIEHTGSPCETFTEIAESFDNALGNLNTLLHMEMDIEN